MKTTSRFATIARSALALATLLAMSGPALAADRPGFFERLVHNYSDPKNLIIGAVLGVAAAALAGSGKKKK